MVGANYTGGRRNAAKARSKDTTGRLQRGHFSKQRLAILTDALRSRRPDHQPLTCSRPAAAADHPNPTSNPRSGSLYSTPTPAATIYDISLGHAQRDLAQKKALRNGGGPFLPTRLDPCVRNDLPAVTPVDSSTSLALTGKGEPDPAAAPQTLLPPSCATTPSPPSHSLPQPNSPQESPFRRRSLLERQPAPVTRLPRSKILDLIHISDREHIPFCGFLGVPHCPYPTNPITPCRLTFLACTIPLTIHPANHPEHSYSYSAFPICSHP